LDQIGGANNKKGKPRKNRVINKVINENNAEEGAGAEVNNEDKND